MKVCSIQNICMYCENTNLQISKQLICYFRNNFIQLCIKNRWSYFIRFVHMAFVLLWIQNCCAKFWQKKCFKIRPNPHPHLSLTWKFAITYGQKYFQFLLHTATHVFCKIPIATLCNFIENSIVPPSQVFSHLVRKPYNRN